MLLHKQKEIQKAYKAYYKLLFSIAIKKVGHLETAEDICHEVFIALNEKFAQVKNIKNWLLGALRNQLLEHMRKNTQTISKTLDIDIYLENLIEKSNQNLDVHIILNEILNKEGTLPRQIFELRNLYGWTLTKIAKELQITRRKVRYIYEKSAKSLLDQLKKKGISTFGDIL